ncbi:MAG: hypothetical protein K0R24_1690 [Gammaproteobacteria bacterium]|jgi:hypothetical protein|nr:hypothetical protein [Gammaproteobacteria bacterium]
MQTISEWVLNEYGPDEIKDIVNHGISGGFSGMTYYKETVAFHDKHEEEIWERLNDNADSQGCTALELLSHFNGQKQVTSMDAFKNMLAWYAVEEACREIIDGDYRK